MIEKGAYCVFFVIILQYWSKIGVYSVAKMQPIVARRVAFLAGTSYLNAILHNNKTKLV